MTQTQKPVLSLGAHKVLLDGPLARREPQRRSAAAQSVSQSPGAAQRSGSTDCVEEDGGGAPEPRRETLHRFTASQEPSRSASEPDSQHGHTADLQPCHRDVSASMFGGINHEEVTGA